MTDPHITEAALAFLKSKNAGVLSTLSRDGQPRGRLVYFSSDDTFTLYFLTMSNTRKADDIEAHPKAAFTIADETVPQTLQIEGHVVEITNSPTEDAVIEDLFKHLQMNTEYFAPIARFDRGDVRFYKLTPTFVRFGNFVSGHSTTEVLFDVTP